jgi:hypothetical protein
MSEPRTRRPSRSRFESEFPEDAVPAPEAAQLQELRALLGAQAKNGLDEDGQPDSDPTLLRFIRARKGDMPGALKQYLDTKEWRRANDIGRFRRNAPGPHLRASPPAEGPHLLSSGGVEILPQLRLMEPRQHEGAWLYYGGPTVAFGHDKEGRPIHLQRTGVASLRMAEGFKFFSPNALDQFVTAGHVWFQELQAARMEEASLRLGRPVTKQVVIMDLSGLSFWPDPNGMAAFKEFTRISARFYPETLAMQFFVNAPAVFTNFWRVIKRWLDPDTVTKFHVLGRDFAPTLLQYIDASQLPVALGGTNPLDLSLGLQSREEGERLAASAREALQASLQASHAG